MPAEIIDGSRLAKLIRSFCRLGRADMTKNVNYEQEVVLLIESKNGLRVAKPNLQKLQIADLRNARLHRARECYRNEPLSLLRTTSRLLTLERSKSL